MIRPPELMNERKAFCEQLGEECKKAGITQAELAEKLQVQQATISKLFNGKYNPGLDFLLLIANTINKQLTLK